jgi:hypothetical protein
MSPDDLSAVAVVNGDGDTKAIWHVAVEPIVQTARLCGAWVTDDFDIQRKVTAARKVVLLGEEPSETLTALLAHTRGVIDLKATLVSIERYMDGLDEVHRASRTPKGSARAPISWPALTGVPDWQSPPPVPAGVVEDPLVRSTIAMAGWLARLADTWSAIETTRTSKAHLIMSNPLPLPLPFVVTNDLESTRG